MAKRESIESALAHLRMALHHLEEAEAADDSPYEPSGIIRLIKKRLEREDAPQPRD